MINPLLYFLLFLKASLFSVGGFSNLPSVRQDLLGLGWATDTDFGESIAIGQLSPGPNGLWVVSLGYFTYGYLGAALAMLAITLPPLLVLVVVSIHTRIEQQRWVAGAMRGVSLAVIGILISVSWTLVHRPDVMWTDFLIAACAFALVATRRLPLIAVLALAAIAGFVLYG